jgi:predicted metal-dependent hydrolase
VSVLLVRIDKHQIDVEVARKEIRHLYIRVDRIDGRVRVSAPRGMSDDAIRDAVRRNHDWIARRRESATSRESPARLELVTGDPVPVLGDQVHLYVRESNTGRRSVHLDAEGRLAMHIAPGSTRETRATLLDDWYRRQLRDRIPVLIKAWEPEMGVSVAEWGVKRMRTRWGSCNPRARRIWLSLELARRPVACLEYVVVHEMVHLLERGHNRRFYAFMDQFLPDWRLARAELRSSPPD